MVNDYFCGQLRQSINALFPLENTQEVINLNYGEISPVPGVSAALIGVVNQRGKLLWVLDLSDLLQIPSDQKTRRSQDNVTLLVLKSSNNSEQQVGCVVSTLKGIISLDLATQSLSSNFDSKWKFLGIKILMIEEVKYAVIDVKAILTNISNFTITDNNYLASNL